MAGSAVKDGYDVLGFGIVTVDDLLYVPAYPAPETKVRVRARVRQCGGLTGTALVTSARLGSRCAYAGALGHDELSECVRSALMSEHVDLAHLAPGAACRPFHSTIVVDESAHTRTILFEAGEPLPETLDWPPAAIIRAARVLFVDHHETAKMVRAARIAREAGIPVVADLEKDESAEFPELLSLIDHLIVGAAFARHLTGKADPRDAARSLWSEGRAAVVVTCGAAGAWSAAGPGDSPRHQPAFAVEVVDTTGCGDVFHGAYATALARGLDLVQRLRFAAAAAALKAKYAGGQAGIPTRAVVESFLSEHPH